MSSRVLARFVSRRFSSSGKILSEEEKAAENVYIKKMEKEKLEKLARKWRGTPFGFGRSATMTNSMITLDLIVIDTVEALGPNPEEKPPTGSGDSGSATEAKASGHTSNSGVSTDKDRNYVLLAGIAGGLSGLGWYVYSKKKAEEVQD
ncbi:hypothetical protein AgCh_035987 [Apium graveolens]